MNGYSVLMSVYSKEQPEYLQAAIESILNQTIKAQDIVLVCDGPLTDGLEQVILEYKEHLCVVRLSENRGLGNALSEGIKYCQCQWIVRMDSDDIAVENRCELQLAYIQEHKDIDVLSGTIAEFEGAWTTAEDAEKHVTAYKKVPCSHREIAQYIKYRNPINHPCVIFRKDKVQEAGGYQPCPWFEDYDLWVRMLIAGCRFANLSQPVLYMRVNGMYQRRGGIRYAQAIIAFRRKMYQRHVISLWEYLYTTFLRVMVSLLPNGIRKILYDRKLRNH